MQHPVVVGQAIELAYLLSAYGVTPTVDRVRPRSAQEVCRKADSVVSQTERTRCAASLSTTARSGVILGIITTAVLCRWTATRRPASWPTPAPGVPGTRNRSTHTAARSPGPSWRSWRRCCGASTTPGRGAASRHTKPLPRRPSAPGQSVRERDLFGRIASRWRVIRTSNAYVFRDSQQRAAGHSASKSENHSGTLNQEFLLLTAAPPVDPDSPLERALARFGTTIEARLLANRCGGQVLAT